MNYQMLDILLTFLGAFTKSFSIAGVLNLPLDNVKNFVYSSESILLLFLFLFVVGETRAVFPALVVTVMYLYIEVAPRRLKLRDDFFRESQRNLM